MHHEVAVRMHDGLAHLQEQRKSRIDIEDVVVAIPIDRDAFDVLHGKPRRTVGSDSSVDEMRDVRMYEAREDLAFVRKTLRERRGSKSRARDLQRHALFELRRGTVRDPVYRIPL